MIYFDNNKIAHNIEIDNYICSIKDSLWIQYNTTDKWDIINGKFVDISNTEDYKQKDHKADIEIENHRQGEGYKKQNGFVLLD